MAELKEVEVNAFSEDNTLNGKSAKKDSGRGEKTQYVISYGVKIPKTTKGRTGDQTDRGFLYGEDFGKEGSEIVLGEAQRDHIALAKLSEDEKAFEKATTNPDNKNIGWAWVDKHQKRAVRSFTWNLGNSFLNSSAHPLGRVFQELKTAKSRKQAKEILDRFWKKAHVYDNAKSPDRTSQKHHPNGNIKPQLISRRIGEVIDHRGSEGKNGPSNSDLVRSVLWKYRSKWGPQNSTWKSLVERQLKKGNTDGIKTAITKLTNGVDDSIWLEKDNEGQQKKSGEVLRQINKDIFNALTARTLNAEGVRREMDSGMVEGNESQMRSIQSGLSRQKHLATAKVSAGLNVYQMKDGAKDQYDKNRRGAAKKIEGGTEVRILKVDDKKRRVFLAYKDGCTWKRGWGWIGSKAKIDQKTGKLGQGGTLTDIKYST